MYLASTESHVCLCDHQCLWSWLDGKSLNVVSSSSPHWDGFCNSCHYFYGDVSLHLKKVITYFQMQSPNLINMFFCCCFFRNWIKSLTSLSITCEYQSSNLNLFKCHENEKKNGQLQVATLYAPFLDLSRNTFGCWHQNELSWNNPVLLTGGWRGASGEEASWAPSVGVE